MQKIVAGNRAAKTRLVTQALGVEQRFVQLLKGLAQFYEPLTHFLRIVRGILLKGNGIAEVAPDLWPIGLFLLVVLTLAVKRYRQTLD